MPRRHAQRKRFLSINASADCLTISIITSPQIVGYETYNITQPSAQQLVIQNYAPTIDKSVMADNTKSHHLLILSRLDQAHYIELVMQPKSQQLVSVIHVAGADAAKFLQGQLTADVVNLAPMQWCYAGHCDAKGKLWAVMRVVKTGNDFYLLIDPESSDASLTQLKKFSVFSQVTFSDISGEVSAVFKTTSPLPLHQVEQHAQVLAIGFGPSSLHIDLAPQAVAADHGSQHLDAWQRFELETGVPRLAPETIAEYVPQMVGLDRLGGINFKKGCYIGQETVARMHYLGQNKRAPRLLTGSLGQSNHTMPAPGTVLEQKLGDNWRRAGAVINAVRYDSSEVGVLAVLPADIQDDTNIRIKGDEQSVLTLRPKFDN
ncbi:glycine cleavage system protein T [Aliidiomarina maris]|uniref:Glycine cleavage system protein T n=3 Tax=Aliidiomarina maris TaxID=531312 RepID=A0ABY0BVQ9_9GAMM|nr:glycine cleavage system protein T [Aliidiomarina maris]